MPPRLIKFHMLLKKLIDVTYSDDTTAYKKRAIGLADEEVYNFINGEEFKKLTPEELNQPLKHERGETPLMILSCYSGSKNVRALLEAGADVNVKNDYGRTALTARTRIIYSRDNLEIVKLLIGNGADLNAPYSNGAGSATAIRAGSTTAIQDVLLQFKINNTTIQRFTSETKENLMAVATTLIEGGANITESDLAGIGIPENASRVLGRPRIGTNPAQFKKTADNFLRILVDKAIEFPEFNRGQGKHAVTRRNFMDFGEDAAIKIISANEKDLNIAIGYKEEIKSKIFAMIINKNPRANFTFDFAEYGDIKYEDNPEHVIQVLKDFNDARKKHLKLNYEDIVTDDTFLDFTEGSLKFSKTESKESKKKREKDRENAFPDEDDVEKLLRDPRIARSKEGTMSFVSPSVAAETALFLDSPWLKKFIRKTVNPEGLPNFKWLEEAFIAAEKEVQAYENADATPSTRPRNPDAASAFKRHEVSHRK